MVFNTTFNNISVILYVAVSFIGGGNRSTWRKPLTYGVHLAMRGIQTHIISGDRH